MSEPSLGIHGPAPGRAEACEQILTDLPEWFAVESARRDYARAVTDLPTFTALHGDQAVGLLALDPTPPASADVHVMAVKRAFHRRGIGGQLVQAAERWLVEQGTRYLTVKTLSSNSPDPHYAQTRRFYEAQGFTPLMELPELWAPEHPCLVMIKSLAQA